MAAFNVDGVGSLGSQLKSYADDLDSFTDELLIEGGQVIAKEWKREAENAGHRDPSHNDHMIDAIKPGKPKNNKYGDRTIDVFPRGTYPDRRDGNGQKISHAKVAAILNYGRSDLDGSGFVKKAEKAAEKQLQSLENSFLEEYTKKKGLN